MERSKNKESVNKFKHFMLNEEDIKLIIHFVELLYKQTELNGYVEIYFLIPTDEISATNYQVMAELNGLNITEFIATERELLHHPWICICGDDNETNHIRRLWLSRILYAKTLILGEWLSAFEYQVVYSDDSYLQLLIDQYKKLINNDKKIVEFSSSAAKPNLQLSPFLREEVFDLYQPGWNMSLENPEDIVNSFSQLSVKEGYKLRAYQHFTAHGGAGVVYAIPSNIEIPVITNPEIAKPPKPKGALRDFMMAVDGDRSSLSYLQAAICYHELHELGAFWHSVNWGEERILPLEEPDFCGQSISEYLEELNPLLEIKDVPESLFPCFYYEDGKPVILFYTINDVGYVKLNRYKHVFAKTGYTQKVTMDEVGIGGPGKIF